MRGRTPVADFVDGHASTPDLRHRLRLIVITDARLAAPRQVVDVVRAAVGAGAPAVQLRLKEASASELFEAGQTLLPIVRGAGALFFVNDRVDVALALGADGVHLGPEDIPIAAVRTAVGDRLILGASTDDVADARTLVAAGADYIGCGTVYPTSTKPDAGAAIGLVGLDGVAGSVAVPVVGIGGITVGRSEEVAGTRAAGIAVVGAVMGADDVGDAVRGLLEPWS
jgi:thiamine-phosphate diphosphorylase